MKFFGQFLVSKGVITEDILADALIQQSAALPTVAELARKLRLLDTTQILAVFVRQTEARVEFKQACKDLRIWNDAIEAEIRNQLETLRTPLGQLLIQLGATDLTTITRMLDEFLSRIESVEKGGDTQQPPPVSPEKSDRPDGAKVDPILLEELVGYLNEGRLESMKLMFTSLEAGTSDPDMSLPLLKELLVEFRSLKGLLRFIQIERTEAAVSLLENLIYLAVEQGANKDLHLVPALCELGKEGTEMLASVKDALKRDGTEAPWFSDPSRAESVSRFFGRLNELTQKEKTGA